MTESERRSRPSLHRRRPGPLAVPAASAATLLVLLSLLGARLMSGRDPALARGSVSQPLTAAGAGGAAYARTSASGAPALRPAQGAAFAAGTGAPTIIRTRTSGSVPEQDDG